MKKYILSYICNIEGKKSALKQLHWAADNLPQHELCDKIADTLSDFQDKIAEVEQSISGTFKIGKLVPTSYKTTNLKKFVEDVLDDANTFHTKLEKEGDTYKGMRSDVEAFLSDFQRYLYLVDFTMKESLKQRLRSHINENRVTLKHGNTTYSLTENELRELVNESIKRVKRNLLTNKKRGV